MTCCIDELCNKDVINIENGCRIGYVSDVEVDTSSGCISTLIVSKNDKNISFKKPDYLKINWNDIVVMGDTTILVKNVAVITQNSKETKRFFDLFAK